MNENPIIIIHGWSDDGHSFKKLANIIHERTKRDTHLINIADYISMDDSVTMDDLVTAMQNAWQRAKLPTKQHSVDAIIHSTGGLIIRDWMTRYYTDKNVPIKHLVMLAPANFGSPLAQKGRAFIGRIIKGITSKKMFQTGEQILKALELASPYSWNLAFKDLLGKSNYYGPGKTLCTILIGNEGYRGIRAAANEPGMDGTVRISSANLDCSYFYIDFTKDPKNPTYKITQSNGKIAFAIIDKENHSSITSQDDGHKNIDTIEHIINGLTIKDDEFLDWRKRLQQANNKLMSCGKENLKTQGFQNTVFRLTDQYDQHIQDYFLEFYEAHEKEDWFAEFFHENVIHSIHAYEDDPSYRSLFINCTVLSEIYKRSLSEVQISLTAMPEFSSKQVVGYRTFDKNDFGALSINKKQLQTLFQENRTALIDVKIKREQAESVFEFNTINAE